MATPIKSKEMAFNGRLKTAVDGASIGPNDFQVLKNLRYTDTNVKGVGGMTKINTSALASTGIRNGFHFRKSQPVESHVLAWTTDGKVWKNDTAVPSQGAFTGSALFTDTAGGSTGRFANAPGGAMVYANGKEACLWGGTEHRCSGFIDYPTTGQIYDYSDMITNTKTDSNNVATIHTVESSEADANTLLLLHMNGSDSGTTFTDSSPTSPHTVTANGGAQTKTATSKFGGSSGYFDGNGDYLSIPDAADFDLSGGVFTIDCWIYVNFGASNQIYYQQTDANNYFKLYLQRVAVGGVGYYYVPTLSIFAASSSVVYLQGTGFTSGGWHHIALVENGDSWYMFTDGALTGFTTDTSRAANYTGSVQIGYDGTNYMGGYLDELRLSNSARWTSDFSPASAPYGPSFSSATYIGSIMPLDGVKFTVGTTNPLSSGTATMEMHEWNGSGWAALTITDNTALSSRALEQTGTVTWSSTANTSKPTQIEKVYLYWYKMVITSDADFSGITLSNITVSIPFQAIRDIWDGSERPANSVLGQKSSVYYDFTSNVLENSYSSTGSTADAATFASLTGYTSSDYLYVGCIERLAGVIINLIDANVNIIPSIMNVSYWDGTAWVALTVQDGTADGTKTLGKSGWVTWSPAERSGEFKRANLGSGKLTEDFTYHTGRVAEGTSTAKVVDSMYFYRIGFSATITNPTNIYHIAGIPVQKDIRGYSFPVYHQNRTVLVSNTDGAKNTILMSAMDYPNTFNGLDAYEFDIGQEEAIISSASLFLRFGSSVQDMLLLAKQGEMHVLEGNGTDSDPYRQRLLNSTVGCRAPLTMVTVPVGDLGGGIRRQLAIWESQRGIEVFDGTSLMDPLLSHDIEDKFDPNHANYAGSSSNAGFYDPVYDEYHWLPVGSAEWVYSFKYKKWHQPVRGPAKYLYGGIPVMDTSGNSYVYGFDNAGYLYRLENGTDFDGNTIAHTLRTGDMAFPEGSIMEKSRVNWFRLVAKAKTVTDQNIAMVYYNDTQNTSYGPKNITPVRSGYRLITEVSQNKDLQSVFHGFEFSISTDDETCGFEPLFLGIRYTVFPDQLS